MTAAALAYFEEGPPPKELTWALQNKQWGIMPRAGGYEDQPIGVPERMSWAYAVYKACQGYTEANDLGVWIKNNPEAHDLYKEVIDMLAEDGLI